MKLTQIEQVPRQFTPEHESLEMISDDGLPDVSEDVELPQAEIVEYVAAEEAERGAVREPSRSDDLLGIYLKSIGSFKELTTEEVTEKSKRVRAGLWAAQWLASEKDADSPHARRLAGIIEDARLARNEIWERNLHLVVSQAWRFRGRGIPLLDLIQEGNLGLLKAIEGYDYRLGYKFSTYAYGPIKKKITQAFAKMGSVIKVNKEVLALGHDAGAARDTLYNELGREPSTQEVAEKLQVSVRRLANADRGVKVARPLSLDAALADDKRLFGDVYSVDVSAVSTEHAVEERDIVISLWRQINKLPAQEQKVLRLRVANDMTYEAISQVTGYDRQAAFKMLKRAIAMMLHPVLSTELGEVFGGPAEDVGAVPACHGSGLGVADFFPVGAAASEEALRRITPVCRPCPLRGQCANYAARKGFQGSWGLTTQHFRTQQINQYLQRRKTT